MGLLDNTNQRAYYEDSSAYGNYQFVSLEDIINQFMVAFVGEEKIIGKASKIDVAFHAQRALRELSFDTFKSIKSQEIELPPSLTMILPHDYVNYTKVSWSDSAGIKHPLYPTKHTSNPFKIQQDPDGSYDFTAPTATLITNNDFSDSDDLGGFGSTKSWKRSWVANNPTIEEVSISSGALQFTHGSKYLTSSITSRAYVAYQKIKVTGMDYLELSGKGLNAAGESGVKDPGVIRLGITTSVSNPNGASWDPTKTNPNATLTLGNNTVIPNPEARNHKTDIFDLQTSSGSPSYLEWSTSAEAGTAATKTLENIDVTNVPVDPSDNEQYVYIVIASYITNYTTAWTSSNNNESINTMDDVEIIYDGTVNSLQTDGESTTWTNYKSSTPAENQEDYQDDSYWSINQKRYGLEPSHAQVNGSFYIDNLKGLINFSSNISGKTVILDYISDSLGTDKEMQVHKLAEDAMYKHILCDLMSTRMNVPEYAIRRYKKDKFAAIRKAKLRLSNIKLEELTQILRGKSKHIKH